MELDLWVDVQNLTNLTGTFRSLENYAQMCANESIDAITTEIYASLSQLSILVNKVKLDFWPHLQMPIGC
jgi:hypothetical protein